MQVSNHIIKSIDKELIKSSAKLSYHYAFTRPLKISQNKPNYVTPVYESIISQNAQYSYYYAKLVLGSRFELGEETIATSAADSYWYAHTVLRGPFHKGGKAIATNVYYTNQYTSWLLKTGFNLSEEIIISNKEFNHKRNLHYVKNIIG